MDNYLLHHHATSDVAGNSVGASIAPTNAIGASTAPTHELPSAAFRPDGANDLARIDDHLSGCTQASHLSACTAEAHASVITEDSMLNHEPLPVTAVAPSGDQAEVNPESSSCKGLAQCVIVCSTRDNETHITTPETEVRSPNDPLVDADNPAKHRSSAVSNRAAAGLGGDLGSYGPPTVHRSTSAEGEVGFRVHPASPMTLDNVIPVGGDGSGATPGHAPPNYEHAPTTHYAPGAFHHPPAHAMGSSTSVSQHNDVNQPNYTTVPGCNTSVWTHDNNNATTGGDGCSSSHNGNQGWFDTTKGKGIGKGTGSVLTGRVHVAHDPGQAPETFTAQALHVVR
jgi:hypothetical protein